MVKRGMYLLSDVYVLYFIKVEFWIYDILLNNFLEFL